MNATRSKGGLLQQEQEHEGLADALLMYVWTTMRQCRRESARLSVRASSAHKHVGRAACVQFPSTTASTPVGS